MASASGKEQDGNRADFIRIGMPVKQFDAVQAYSDLSWHLLGA